MSRRVADNMIPPNVGTFAWRTDTQSRHITMRLPCGHVANLPVEGERAWQWDGNEDAPTLTPSILCMSRSVNQRPAECWHGYMTSGELRAV